MRILIFNWKDIKHPYAGGAEINIHEQAKLWIKQGHTVTQISPRFKNSKKTENIDGINITRIGGRFTIYLLAPFLYLTKLRNQCDTIIDIENGIPFFTPLYSRKPKICIMHHVHQNVFFKELPFFIAWIPFVMEKYGIRLFYKKTKFIAVSETTKEEMIKLLRINSKNIKIVYNGIDHTQFLSKKKKTNIPSIIYFGRLMKYKRIDLLLDIFAEVKKIIPEAELYIAGTGIIENELIQYTKNKKISGVKFYGFVSNEKRKDLIKSSWIFINPSSMEGWGVTVIEANALGVPALAFNVPGLREAIKNNETGIIVETKEEMVKKAVELLKNNNLRKEYGKKAMKWSKKFSWEKTAEQTLKILKNEK